MTRVNHAHVLAILDRATEALKVTDKALAAHLGVHYNSICNWRAGRHLPVLTNWKRLAKDLSRMISDAS